MIATASAWKRPFFTIWIGQAFSLLGSQLVQFALIWYLTEKTGSAVTLATASLAGLLPQVFLSPFIGALVDRYNRRRIMIFADAGIALATLLLMLLFILNRVEVWHIYVALFIRAVGSGFHGPAMGASTALMVPKEHLTRIQGINQALFGGLNIVAAPLGALLLKTISMTGILLIDAITAIIAITPLLFIDVPQPLRNQTAKSSLWQDIREGLRYVVGWKGLLFILIMAMLINFLMTPAFSLLPLLVRVHFGGDALQLGWINSASGIGVVIGGVLLGAWGGFKRRVTTALVGLIGLGSGTVFAGLAPADALWLSPGRSPMRWAYKVGF